MVHGHGVCVRARTLDGVKHTPLAAEFVFPQCTHAGNAADCSGLGLQRLPSNLPAPLERLLADHNSITQIGADDLEGLARLRDLVVGSNMITQIAPGALRHTPRLRALDLSNNRLATVAKDLLSPSGLEHLDFSSNAIDNLERAALFYLGSLSTLDLSGNKLAENNLWSGSFFHLVNMTSLKLNANQFEDLRPCASMLTQNTALRALEMASNAITAVPPDLFAAQGSLKILNLADNQITALPEELFQHQKELQSLYLGGNNIKSIPSQTFAPLESLESLEMIGNPSSCVVAGCQVRPHIVTGIVLPEVKLAHNTFRIVLFFWGGG